MTTDRLPATLVVDEAMVAWPARRPRNFRPFIKNSNNVLRVIYYTNSVKGFEAITNAQRCFALRAIVNSLFVAPSAYSAQLFANEIPLRIPLV